MKELIIFCCFTFFIFGLSAQNSRPPIDNQNQSTSTSGKHYCGGCHGQGFRVCQSCGGVGRAYGQMCFTCQGKQYAACHASACGARQYTLRQSQIVLENTYRQYRHTYSFPIKYYYIINTAGLYEFYYEDQYGNTQKITE